MDKQSKVYVPVSEGVMGSGLSNRLRKDKYPLLTGSVDLTNQFDVEEYFLTAQPEIVFLTSIKEGGIFANTTYPADFGYANLQTQLNIMHSSLYVGVEKLLFFGSSCMYPKHNAQPMKETDLLTGPMEPTSETYAIAKIAGVKMCQAYSKQHGANFISAIPTNVYGPEDDFDPKTSHVISALIKRFHEATLEDKKEVVIWGSGKPEREFLYADDFADASLFVMNNYESTEPINIGYGSSVSIKELGELISDLTSFKGDLVFDTTKPDGAPKKMLDSTKLTDLGWKPSTDLRTGLEQTYSWWLQNLEVSYNNL